MSFLPFYIAAPTLRNESQLLVVYLIRHLALLSLAFQTVKLTAVQRRLLGSMKFVSLSPLQPTLGLIYFILLSDRRLLLSFYKFRQMLRRNFIYIQYSCSTRYVHYRAIHGQVRGQCA
jgi:hypothetical protein